jgi:hypothetical protein
MSVFRIAWKLGLVAVVLGLAAWISAPYWAAAIGGSLICVDDVAPSDAMLLENFDPNYLVFERAAELEKRGFARRAFVPVEVGSDSPANPVSAGIAEVMARQARLLSWEPVVITLSEPFSLNVALQMRTRLVRDKVRSVILIAPRFRSHRSSLVYRATLEPAGIVVRCVPVGHGSSPGGWTKTWHGVQVVVEELIKLAYYRFYVLPSSTPPSQRP